VKRLLVVAVMAALALPAGAAAHPLGNFTVNRYAGIEISGRQVYLEYVLDLAEIPTVQEGERVRRPGFAADLARRLEVRVDGRRAELRLLAERVRSRPGSGGLPTLRFEAVFDAGRAGTKLSFRDGAFPGRIGWREVVVRAERDAEIRTSSAPATSTSDALRSYPRGLLDSPPDVRAAEATTRAGEAAGTPPQLAGPVGSEPESHGFEALVERDAEGWFLMAALGLALFWGAAHALGPGHGKAIVAGYLVGSRGKARHALLLGLIVTVTHTIGVFTLGLVTLGLSELVLPETLYPWLNLVSALLVVGVGVAVVRHRVRDWLHARAHARAQTHTHAHHHGHSHDHAPGGGLRGLVAAGVSGGIVPCPTALVVLLAAISLHRVAFGLVLIVAFSVGLAATVSAVGLVAVAARRAFARLDLESGAFRLLPAASAAVVLVLGLAMTVRAVPGIL
jgi:nickel/cobalt exporter